MKRRWNGRIKGNEREGRKRNNERWKEKKSKGRK